MNEGISEERLREMIVIASQVAGSQAAFARQLGVAPQYVNDMIMGRSPVGPKVIEWFGLERVVTYRRKDGGRL